VLPLLNILYPKQVGTAGSFPRYLKIGAVSLAVTTLAKAFQRLASLVYGQR